MSSFRIAAAALLLSAAACGPDDGQPVPSAPASGETTAMSSLSLVCNDSKQGLCAPVPHWPTWLGRASERTGVIVVAVSPSAAEWRDVLEEAVRDWERVAAEWVGREPETLFRVGLVDAESEPYATIYVDVADIDGNFLGMTGWSWEQDACRLNKARITFEQSVAPTFGVAFHEFGHALGIPHRESSDAMSCEAHTCVDFDSCELLDLERAHAARAIFGVGAGPTFGL